MGRLTTISLILSFLLTIKLQAETYISGEVSGIWDLSGSPYLIDGDCYILESDTLICEAGVAIELTGDWEFSVYGWCFFLGVEGDEIQVSSTEGGRFQITDGSADWEYVGLSAGLDEVNVEYGQLALTNCEFTPGNSAILNLSQSIFTVNSCSFNVNSLTDESYFINCTGGDAEILSSTYWSDCAGLISTTNTAVEISQCDFTYYKDDWYDGSFFFNASEGTLHISDSNLELIVEAGSVSSTGTMIKMESGGELEITGNELTGTIQIDDEFDTGSIIVIYGGTGQISENTIMLGVDAASVLTEPELEFNGIQYFSGEIGYNELHISSGGTENSSSSTNGIGNCQGFIHRNLLAISSETWSYGLNSCEGDIVNNTIHVDGNDPQTLPHYSVANCYGTLKNNIIMGSGEAVTVPGNLIHTYNCYWGFGESPEIPPLSTGEIYADPVLDETYNLMSMSPCINTADPNSPYDPDSTRADMGSYYTDQSDRPVIVNYGPETFIYAPEHTSSSFWISAIDPANTGLSYIWVYRGSVVSNDSTVVIDFLDAGLDSVKAIVYNSVGSDSQKWVFELTTVNINIHVPENFGTIQEAIDYSSYQGDTILISAGIYYENLQMINKSVALVGTADPEEVIIDGGNAASVLRMENCCTDTVLLENLTFQHGSAISGGGIYGNIVLLKMDNCLVVNNETDSETNSYGGGIYLNICYAEIENTTIESNLLHALNYGRGGGLYCNGLLVFRDGSVLNNGVISETVMGTGGGIHYSGGGGTIENSVIRGNIIDGGTYVFGAGIRCSNADLKYNEVTENVIIEGICKRGGGIYAIYSSIDHCTVARNEAEMGAGLYVQISGASSASNLIVAFNEGDSQIEVATNAALDINYSDVHHTSGEMYENCQPEVGCIGLDPLFTGGDPFDFYLTDSSPCIDAGDPTAPYDPDGTITDMGCYYFEATGLHEEIANSIPEEFALFPPYPNPFNPATVLSFNLPAASWVKLEVFDIAGRSQGPPLQNGWREAGHHEVSFDGSSIASGIYFYRIEAGDFESVGKMLLIK